MGVTLLLWHVPATYYSTSVSTSHVSDARCPIRTKVFSLESQRWHDLLNLIVVENWLKCNSWWIKVFPIYKAMKSFNRNVLDQKMEVWIRVGTNNDKWRGCPTTEFLFECLVKCLCLVNHTLNRCWVHSSTSPHQDLRGMRCQCSLGLEKDRM